MSYSFYVSQLEDWYLLYGTFENSLRLLKFLNANCPERILMLNKLEEEVDKIEQRMDAFDIHLIKDNEELLKVYKNNEQGIIKKMCEKISHDLSVLVHKIADLKKEHTFDIDNDNLENKTKQDMPYSFYVSQLENLYSLNDTFKNSLGPLKSANTNCPERSLMLNRIEEELNGIGRSIDAFDILLIKDDEELLKVYKNNEQGIIKKMYEEIRHDLFDKMKELSYLIAPNCF